MKKKTQAQLKKELDKVYSLYIRLKYSKDGICHCYTCHKPLEVKSAHCGHFIPRQYLITRWDERNTRPQCIGCNIFGNGKILDFEERLVNELGQEEVDRLKNSRHQIFKVDSVWYEKQISHYKLSTSNPQSPLLTSFDPEPIL